MTKKVEFIWEDEAGKELATFKSKNTTKLFNKLKQGTPLKLHIQEDGFGKQFVGNYIVKGLDNEPIPPEMNIPPEMAIKTPINGTVNTEIVMAANISDPDGRIIDTEWVQLIGPPVTLTVKEDGEYSATFKPTVAGQYSFLANAFDDRGAKVGQEVIVNVGTGEPIEPPVEPPVEPAPEPPTGNVLYDSKIHSKLHDGKKRTIKTEGFLTPNGLGMECRASGNPRVVVNEDGTYSLVTDAGHGRYYLHVHNINTTSEITAAFWNEQPGQDISMKKWSRHNEGGDCDNRYGGRGLSVDRSGWGEKREDCHNVHSQSTSGSLPAKMETKKFNVWRFTVKEENGKMRMIGEMDGKKFMDKLDSSPKPYMIDISKYLGKNQSYEWVRSNNEKAAGEIRIKQHRVLKA